MEGKRELQRAKEKESGAKNGVGGTEGRSLAGEWREGAGGSDVAAWRKCGRGWREGKRPGTGGNEGHE